MGLNPAKCWAFLLFSILSVVSPQFRSLEELQHYWFSYKISFAVQLEAKKPFKLTRSFCYHAFCIFLDRSWAWTWKMGRVILYSSKRAKAKPWETSSTSTLCKVCLTCNCQNSFFTIYFPNSALICAWQLMTLLGFSYHLMLQRDSNRR